MSSLEALGAALGLLNQWLTIRQRIWCWPVGIASVIVYLFVFYDAKLYSDMLLQGVYIALQLYGWINWLKVRDDAARPSVTARRFLPVSRLQSRGWVILVMMSVVLTSALGTLMGHYTDAALPYWDAAPTVLSLIAQFLQARKVLESWLLFIVANALFIGVYAVKGLYITIALFVVITILAGFGFVQWRRAYRASGVAS